MPCFTGAVGWEFADRIRKEKESEVKFNFLNSNNPYNAYFLHMIEEIRSGRNNGMLVVHLAW